MKYKNTIYIVLFSILTILSTIGIISLISEVVSYDPTENIDFFNRFNTMTVIFFSVILIPVFVLSVVGLIKSVKERK